MSEPKAEPAALAPRSPPPPPPRPPGADGPDALAIMAYVAFVLVGGLLVFGFARSVAPALAKEAEGTCRALTPEAPKKPLMPVLSAQTLDGESVSLEDLRGKLVVVNFWATWCEPCTREWPELDKLAQRFEDRDDVVVVAVSIDKDKDAIAPYLERMSLSDTPVLVWWDPTTTGNAQFGGEKIPDTYFVDASGRFTQAFINVRQWGSPAAYRCVEGSAP